MRSIIHRSFISVLVMCALAIPGTSAFAAGSIHIAFGDVPGSDMLNFLVAANQAEARGVKLWITYLRDEESAGLQPGTRVTAAWAATAASVWADDADATDRPSADRGGEA